MQVTHGADEADGAGHTVSLGLYLGDGGDDVHRVASRERTTADPTPDSFAKMRATAFKRGRRSESRGSEFLVEMTPPRAARSGAREGGKQMTGGIRATAELLPVLGANKGARP